MKYVTGRLEILICITLVLIHWWINLKANQHNSNQHIHILTLWNVFAVYFSTTLPLCAFHWHCMRYVASNHSLFNCLFNNSVMPTSSVHIIDSLWRRRSSLDSLRDERLNWIMWTHLLIWRILFAVLERYSCRRIPLQITRRLFCYSVSDRYRAFISANSMWKCGFDIVLISPTRHHRRNFLCQSYYSTYCFH